MQKKVTNAIFPVAGLGTRFLPATKAIPKEIMTLVDKALIQYPIDEVSADDIKEFIFVTSVWASFCPLTGASIPPVQRQVSNVVTTIQLSIGAMLLMLFCEQSDPSN